jgi:hypothetical protein
MFMVDVLPLASHQGLLMSAILSIVIPILELLVQSVLIGTTSLYVLTS